MGTSKSPNRLAESHFRGMLVATTAAILPRPVHSGKCTRASPDSCLFRLRVHPSTVIQEKVVRPLESMAGYTFGYTLPTQILGTSEDRTPCASESNFWLPISGKAATYSRGFSRIRTLKKKT